MALGEKALKFWRDRLFHADMVWKDHGLHKGGNEDILDYLKAYRGIQWKDGLGEIEPAQCQVVNMVFSITNTLMSSLLARNPRMDVYAEDEQAKDSARVMELLLNYLIRSRKLKMKRELNRALRDALLMPGGVVRHVWTPEIEYRRSDNGELLQLYDPAKPDFPAIKRVPLWDFRCDPLAESFDPDGSARWCAFRTLHTKAEIRANPNMIDRRDLQATVSFEKMEYMKGSRPFESPDEAKLVEVWTFYDKVDRTTFALSPGTDKPVREESDWPVPWPHLPFNFLGFNEQADDPFPVPFPAVYWQLQQERNKVRTMANELVKRLRRLVFVNGDALVEEDQDRLEDSSLTEILRTKGVDPKTVVSNVQTGGLPQELLLYDTKIEDDVRKMVGVGDMNRGQRINVESATEAQNVAAGQQVQIGRNQGPFEDFVGDVFAAFGVVLQQSVTGDFAVPILGTEDAATLLGGEGQGNPFLSIGPKQIQGEFVYELRPGSMLPRDPNEDQRNALSLAQALAPFEQDVVKPQLMLDILRAWERDPKKYFAQTVRTPSGAALAEEAPQARPEEPAVNVDLAQILNGGA